MRRFITALVMLAALLGLAPFAQAYDVDTHFYGTYAMARYAGIRHEVAAKIATSAQWMDESFISDPVSMIFLPVTGVKKRRLLHFPSSRVVGTLAADAQHSILGTEKFGDFHHKLIEKLVSITGYEGELSGLNFFTETEEDHAFASELLMQGLKQGNLMMASASLHVLEDSFAHAGTPAEQGHSAFWHWPDRPFGSPDKYFRMTRAVFQALVAIRSQLPADALDCNLQLLAAPAPGNDVNCKMSAQALADNYSQLPQVVNAVTRDILKDPEYVTAAIRDFFARAIRAKYIKMNQSMFNQLLASVKIDGSKDAYTTLVALIHECVKRELTKNEKIMDVEFILADMGRRPRDSKIPVSDYIDSFGPGSKDGALMNPEGMDKFVKMLAFDLLRWEVPMPLTESHRMEVENDKGVTRAKEMDIRIRDMKNAILALFNIDVHFVPNNTGDQTGFGKEVRMDETAEPVFDKKSSAAQVTFNLLEKNAWNKMIFTYLFPSLTSEDLLTLVGEGEKIESVLEDIGTYREKRKEINESDSNFVVRKASLLKLDFEYKHVVGDMVGTVDSVLDSVKPMLPKFVGDLVNSHMVAGEDNFFYRNDRLFSDYKEKGVVKPFLGKDDVWYAKNILKQFKTVPYVPLK